MSWHHACKKLKIIGDLYEYGLVEVYTIDGETYYTEDAVRVWGATPEDLAKWLRRAADDVDKYGEVEECTMSNEDIDLEIIKEKVPQETLELFINGTYGWKTLPPDEVMSLALEVKKYRTHMKACLNVASDAYEILNRRIGNDQGGSDRRE